MVIEDIILNEEKEIVNTNNVIYKSYALHNLETFSHLKEY